MAYDVILRAHENHVTDVADVAAIKISYMRIYMYECVPVR